MTYYDLKSKEVFIRTGQVSYLRAGSGEPMVLIHGFTNSFRDWNEKFIFELSKTFELFMVNLKGVGHSTSTDPVHSIESYADEIIQFCDVIGMKTFHLLGHSMGGYISQEIALRVQDRIKSLVLLSTRMGKPFLTPGPAWAHELMSKKCDSDDEKDKLIASLLVPPSVQAELVRIFKQRRELRFGDNDVPDETVEAQRDARVVWLDQFGKKGESYTQFQFFSLIVAGTDDLIIPIENSYELSKHLPNSWFIKISNAGHSLFHHYPYELAAAIEQFEKNIQLFHRSKKGGPGAFSN